MREGETRFVKRVSPSRALPFPLNFFVGDSGGEAASLREAPLPQTPSPEERMGIGLVVPLELSAHASAVGLR